MRFDGRSSNDYRSIQVQFESINNSYGCYQLTLVYLFSISNLVLI
jgi:exosome complex RNA-binding protein Rrp42 (RNase PH superfamily)